MKSKRLPVLLKMCQTCPFREGSKYANLRPMLTEECMKHSRICHQTGTNALMGKTGKPERLCRGARDVQLNFFASIGFLPTSTDEAWEKRCNELGIQ